MATHNAKFPKIPFNDKTCIPPLAEYERMDTALCVKELRTVSNDLTLQYDWVRFILEPNDVTAGLQRKKVMVYDYPDGRMRSSIKVSPFPILNLIKLVMSIKAQS